MDDSRATKKRLSRPHPGADSYQVEDAELFFGREREAEQLVAMVLTSPFSVLHARSAAGKTSLLNARVLPQLESRGFTTVISRPHQHPMDSIRLDTLNSLLPPPRAEIRAVDRALEDFREVAEALDKRGEVDASREHLDPLLVAGEAAPLCAFRLAFESLPVRHPQKRHLIRPVEIDSDDGAGSLPGEVTRVTPFFCRYLRGSLNLPRLRRHLQVLFPGDDRTTASIRDDMPVAELIGLLEAATERHGELLNELYCPGLRLGAFFSDLFELFSGLRLRLVVVLDQFEELFTRFGDPGRTRGAGIGDEDAVLPWQLREELFRELESMQILSEDVAGAALPVRWVLSMRDDYIAELDPIRQFVPGLDAATFHLTFLSRNSASQAILGPFDKFGYSFEEACFARILEQLLREERYVKPSHIQIVCSRLWDQKLSDRAKAGGGGDGQRVIDLETLRNAAKGDTPSSDHSDLNETEAILRLFFGQCLNEIQDEIQKLYEEDNRNLPEAERRVISKEGIRLEVLELLEPLITASGTRNIVSRAELVSAPFRSRQLRRRLIAALDRRRVVRVEKRLGGLFVEIAHEFLIEPIRYELAQSVLADPNYPGYRDALMRLQAARWEDFRRETAPRVPPTAMESLALHRERLDWRYLGCEVLLRSALLETAGEEVCEDLIDTWVQAMALSDAPKLARVLAGDGGSKSGASSVLALDELRLINAARDASDGSTTRLAPWQIRTILRSQILHARADEEADILYWLKRFEEHGA